MKWWGWMGILLTSVLLLAGTYLFFNIGLREYSKALWTINFLPKDEKASAGDDFFTVGLQNRYSGMLSRVNGNVIDVWGKNGLKHFETDQYSVYSFFSVCSPETLAQTQKEGTSSIERSVDFNIAPWLKKVRQGDYLIIVSPPNDPQKLREVYVYDWWVFIPNQLSRDLKKQCKQRN